MWERRSQSLILFRKKNKTTTTTTMGQLLPALHRHTRAHTHGQKTNFFFFLIEHDHNSEWNPGLMWCLAGGAGSEPRPVPHAPSAIAYTGTQ